MAAAGMSEGLSAAQVGVDMSRFRAFPYRGSLLRSQTGSVQEVSHPSQPLCTSGTQQCLAADQPTCHPQTISQNGLRSQAKHV